MAVNETSTAAIVGVIQREFGTSISRKESEVLEINRRIVEVRAALDRLRASVIANYYGSGVTPGLGNARDELAYSRTSLRLRQRQGQSEKQTDSMIVTPVSTAPGTPDSGSATPQTSQVFIKEDCVKKSKEEKTSGTIEEVSKLYVKKRVVIGNTSKFLPCEEKAVGDESTHKWMVYVRGTEQEPCVSQFIRRVAFFLHPSYKPNDLVVISQAPFHLTRRGWGEFPLRVQLHLSDGKTVDVIHHLKLDKTFSGLQTRGAETTVDIAVGCLSFNSPPALLYDIDPDATLFASTGNEEGEEMAESEEDEVNQEPFVNLHKLYLPLPVQAAARKVLFDHCYVSSNAFCLNSVLPSGVVVTDGATLQDVTPMPINESPLPCQHHGGSAWLLRQSQDLDPMKRLIPVAEPFPSPEACFKACVSQFPIVHPDGPSRDHPYAAHSLSEYEKWHVGRKRAAEWCRAKVLRQVVSNAFRHRPTRKLPSTRRILRWCRANGHVPAHCEEESDRRLPGLLVCKICGHQLGEEENGMHKQCADGWYSGGKTSVSSYTVAKEAPRRRLPGFIQSRLGSQRSGSFVDVLGNENIPSSSSPSLARLRSCCLDTPVEEWAYQSVKAIGIRLTDDSENDGQPSVSQVLSVACLRLIQDIVASSIEHACLSSQEPRAPHLITIAHVYQALVTNPRLDIFTNIGLGAE